MNPHRSTFAEPRIAFVTLLTLALVYAGCNKADVIPAPSVKQSSPVSPAANSEGHAVVTVSELA